MVFVLDIITGVNEPGRHLQALLKEMDDIYELDISPDNNTLWY